MTRQLNLGVLDSTMLRHILQGLLHDPKEAESHVLRDISRNVMMNKLDFQLVPLREFSAKACYAGRQTQNVQLGWMQLVRQVVETGRNFPGYSLKGVKLLPCLRRKVGRILL